MRDRFTTANAEAEVLADFVGDSLLGSGDRLDITLEELSKLNGKQPCIIQRIREFVRDMINRFKGNSRFKSLVSDLEYLNKRLEEAARSKDKKSSADTTDKYSIVALDNGNTYVKASRSVIKGDDISEWRKQITNFFNELLEGEKSLNINTIDGDVLTITKSETANKARDNYKYESGRNIRMSDNEFRVKLNAEAHIDELAETSIANNNKAVDTKSHNFAKDGFTYRTAYFQDFDGEYYKITLSIGNNGTVATVYNVGKINKDNLPSHTKIVAVVGSKPLGKLSDNSISNSAENVKTENSNGFNKRLEEAARSKDKKSSADTTEKYTFAGERAETADKSLLETAKERLENGEDVETVRKETGWFKGYDGKWRFEIDDSMSQLVEKPQFETRGNNTDGFYKVAHLEDVFEHPDLFEAYPQLKDYTVIIQETEPGVQGFSFEGHIVLSNTLFERMTKEYSDYLNGWSKAAKSVLLHEIQHHIQVIEGLARGSSPSPRYWGNKMLEAEGNYKVADFKYMKKLDGVIDVLDRYGFYEKYGDGFDIITDEGINVCKNFLTETGAPRGAIEMLEDFAEYKKDRDKAFDVWQNIKKSSPMDLYKSTAGEIEARDTDNRRNLTAEQRKNTRPDIDRTDVVFAGDGVSYSIAKDNDGNNVVVIDTDQGLFVGADESEYRKIAKDYLNEHFKNAILPLSDYGLVAVNKTGIGKYVYSGKNIEGDANNAKMKAATELDNLLRTAEYVKSSGDRKNHNFAADGFDYYKTRFIVGGQVFEGIVDIGVSEKGAEFYGITNIENATSRYYGKYSNLLLGYKSVTQSDIFDTTVPQNEQSVNTNISENAQNDTENSEKYSIPNENSSNNSELDNIAELVRKYDNGEISKEEYYDKMRDEWQKAGNRYGTIPEGENAESDYAVPKADESGKPTRRYVRTILETGKLTDSMKDQIGAEILQGGFSYTPASDESATGYAKKAIEKGSAEVKWQEAIGSGKISKKTVALGEQLLADAIKSKDNARVLELSAELSDVLTRAGQVVQSARLLKQMTGVGRLVALQRTVKTLNADLVSRFGDDAPMIELDGNVAQIMADSETETEIEDAYQDAMQDIADQLPSTALDKWNAWRYFAMLANPRTHIRNIVGNTIFIPAVRTKDVIATGLERVMTKEDRTKVVAVKNEYKEFAKKDLKNSEVQKKLSGSKYDEKSELYQKRRTFKNGVLETVTTKNGDLLEFEDTFFKNKHYIHALGSYLQAQKVDLKNISDSVLNKARDYAANEALKATFNDASAVANYLKQISQIDKNDPAAVKAAKFAFDSVIPFKRTPVNIIRRGVEYSPIGLTKALTKGLYDVKKGEITVSQFADGLAAGLTGSGIFAVGMLLGSLGFVTGSFDDDKEDKFKKLNGEQEYSVNIFGKSYTVDWAAPACIPFFIGVETAGAMSNDGDVKLSYFTDSLWNALEPITNLSMLSGIQSTISAAKYSKPGEVIATIGEDIALSYAMQGVPSILGSVSRTIDKKQRMWYTDKNSGISKFGQEILNNVQSKVPGLSFAQVPKIDGWGRIVTRGNLGERLAENFISPGYYSAVEYDDVNAELKRIYKETGESAVLPGNVPKSFKVGEKQKYLTGSEYVTFATARGQYAFDYVQEFTELPAYKKMTDEQRVKVITELYEYSNAKAKTTVSDYDLTANYKTVANFERNGTSAVYYYINRAMK